MDKETSYGIGLIGIGAFTVVWYIIKLVSCIMIAGLISIRLGLDGYYWWFSSIILFSVLMKIVFYDNNLDGYNELIDRYQKMNNTKCECHIETEDKNI